MTSLRTLVMLSVTMHVFLFLMMLPIRKLFERPLPCWCTAQQLLDYIQCTHVLFMCVWLFARRGGDVMVVELQAHGDQLRGRVTAVLSPPGCSSFG